MLRSGAQRPPKQTDDRSQKSVRNVDDQFPRSVDESPISSRTSGQDGTRSVTRTRSSVEFSVSSQPLQVNRDGCASDLNLRRTASSAGGAVSQKISLHDELKSMVQALQYGNETEQAAASKNLRSISKTSKNARLQLVQIGGLPVLADCLAYLDPSTSLVADAVTICFNLAMEADLARPIALAGILGTLLRILQTKCEAQLNAVGAISNLCINVTNRLEICDLGMIPILVTLARDGTRITVQKDAVVALFNMAIDSRYRNEIVALEIVAPLLDSLDSSDPDPYPIEVEITLLLSSLLKVSAGVEEVLENGGLAVLSLLLLGGAKVQGHATACLLLVAMHGEAALKAVKEEGVVTSLVQIIERGNSRGKEKVWHLA